MEKIKKEQRDERLAKDVTMKEIWRIRHLFSVECLELFIDTLYFFVFHSFDDFMTGCIRRVSSESWQLKSKSSF